MSGKESEGGLHSVYLGLGSNSEDAALALGEARGALVRLPGLRLAAASPLYRTEPQDMPDQPWFLNQVLELEAGPCWEPVPLMRELLELERALGRVRSPDPALRFGPRRIDVDMLLFDEVLSSDPVCLLPHPRLWRRAFWLVPLRDMTPDLRIQGETPDSLLSRLDWRLEGDRVYQRQGP